MKYKPMLLLAAMLLGVAGAASAGDRVENRYGRHASQAHNHGYEHPPNRLEALANRFDQRRDRRR